MLPIHSLTPRNLFLTNVRLITHRDRLNSIKYDNLRPDTLSLEEHAPTWLELLDGLWNVDPAKRMKVQEALDFLVEKQTVLEAEANRTVVFGKGAGRRSRRAGMNV